MQELDDRLVRELGKGRLALAWLLAAAAQRLGHAVVLDSADVVAIGALAVGPVSPLWGLGAEAVALPALLASGSLQPNPTWRVRAFAAVLRQRGESPVDGDALIEAVGLQAKGLVTVVRGLCALARAGLDPLLHLRDELEGPFDVKKGKRRLDAGRKELARELASVRAGLGELEAPDEVARSLAEGLAPLLAEGGLAGTLAPRLRQLARTTLAGVAGLAAPARRQASRALQRLLELAGGLDDVARRMEAARAPRGKAPAAPVAETRALMHALSPLPRAEEELCVQLLAQQMASLDPERARPGARELTLQDLCISPGLLGLIAPVQADVIDDGTGGWVAEVGEVDAVRAAAAILAHEPDEAPSLAQVRKQLVQAQRDDLLHGLASLLGPAERRWLGEAQAARVARILQRCAELEDASASEARAMAGDGSRELRLIEAWLGTTAT